MVAGAGRDLSYGSEAHVWFYSPQKQSWGRFRHLVWTATYQYRQTDVFGVGEFNELWIYDFHQ